MLAKGSLFSHLTNRFLVNTQSVPLVPLQELTIDCKRPIIYVVEQNCASDLLGLQASCKKAGLPDPYQSIQVQGETLSAVIFIHHITLFSDATPQLQDAPYLAQYQKLLDLHQANPALDIQLIPVTFCWGRNPGRDGKKSWFNLSEQGQVGLLHKALIVLKNSRDHLVRFNPPLSVKALSQRVAPEGQAHNLAKVAMRYFGFQKRSSIGPKLPDRKEMIESVLAQPNLQKIIAQAALDSDKSVAQLTMQCRDHLNEISANFSYSFLRIFRVFLKGIWHFIYKGIEVHHAQAVREACQSGAEIIYMPCHRSHMDYLLLSYLLFDQGMVPPHVAAGINLNFFPAGPIFRRSGAFFLRRTFKDDPLYGAVFNAYFAMLFKQGYPIEFFTEGGRSRTGLLLKPKTGLLATSLQTYLKQPERNVIIVPIYIGYDHIMEVNTYVKEQAGQKKESESMWKMLGIVKRLGNFGRAFVNFGEPIDMKQHFDKAIPDWREAGVSPSQFKTQVAVIARKTMVHINEATAVNALPLCASILLANSTKIVDEQRLLQQLAWHQQWLSLNDGASLVTYEKSAPAALLQQALQQNKFQMTEALLSYSPQQALVLDYYRNNIVHVFVLPGLVFSALSALKSQQQACTYDAIIDYCNTPYSQLQQKHFLSDDIELTEIVSLTLDKLLQLRWLTHSSNEYHIVDSDLATLFKGHLNAPVANKKVEIAANAT